MAHIVFYEKPGCLGNAQQKQLLVECGHVLEVRDLLSHPWKPEELRLFFGNRPVAEWFNAFAPDVKSGAVDPASMDADLALRAMLDSPILIKRPLMQIGEQKLVGFDQDALAKIITLTPTDKPIDSCPSNAGDVCSE